MMQELAEFDAVDWIEGARQVNECEYLFVRSLYEVEELTLELLLTEAKPQAAIQHVRDSSAIEKLRLGSRLVEEDKTCRVFKMTFGSRSIVSYSVLNESYAMPSESNEEYTGKRLRVFSRSNLLEFTKRHTNASEDWPGPLQHYEIVSENHVVAVISTKPPEIAVGYRGVGRKSVH